MVWIGHIIHGISVSKHPPSESDAAVAWYGFVSEIHGMRKASARIISIEIYGWRRVDSDGFRPCANDISRAVFNLQYHVVGARQGVSPDLIVSVSNGSSCNSKIPLIDLIRVNGQRIPKINDHCATSTRLACDDLSPGCYGRQ